MKPLCTLIVYQDAHGAFHASADAVGMQFTAHSSKSVAEAISRCSDAITKHLDRKPIAGSEEAERP